MASTARTSGLWWLLAPLAALVLIAVMATARVRYSEALTALGGGAQLAVDATSPTGLQGGVRQVLRPGATEASFEWIAQTQAMLAHEDGRWRETFYDNAPTGRPVVRPAPYRWWLAAMAWIDHTVSGRPLAWSVERASLWADAVLHALVVVVLSVLAWRGIGRKGAAVAAVGALALFPFGARFVAGQPDSLGLALAAVAAALLALVAGANASSGTVGPPGRGSRGWWLAAGVAGGLAGWVWPPSLLVVFGATMVGGSVAAWTGRGGDAVVRPWRWWALGGTVAWAMAFLVEAVPDRVTAFALHGVHPAYLLGWWGGAGWLRSLERTPADGAGIRRRRWRGLVALVAWLAAVVVLVRMIARHGGETQRLSNLPDSVAADGLLGWLTIDSVGPIVATLLPFVGVAALLLWVERSGAGRARMPLLVLAAAGLLALSLAVVDLRGWSLLATILVVALAYAVEQLLAENDGRRTAVVGLAVAAIAGSGLVVAWPRTRDVADGMVSAAEVVALVERDLAHALARRSGGQRAVVLAPPSLSVSLYYYGGLGVLGTPHPGNEAGFAGAVRIAGATSPDEAQALGEGRELAYIVMPSWDPFLDEYARLSGNELEKTLVGLLHRWTPPRWLRPVAYALPAIPGFEGQAAIVYEVVEVQENATALGRLADYFLEMGSVTQAAGVAQALMQVAPDDLESSLTRAQVAGVQGDATTLSAALERLLPAVQSGGSAMLPWDRRVSLAVTMMQVRRPDLARREVERLWQDVDEAHLRGLSTGALYRLILLARALQLPLPNRELQELAPRLLPPELREQL